VALFDDMLKQGETLFRDESVLDFDYLPQLLPYRENQQAYIADCIKPLGQGRQGKSLLIRGSPGIGKTSCVKYVFRRLEEATDDIKPIFINCWKKQTTNPILAEIAGRLGGIGSQFKNNEELWEQIYKGMSRFKGVVIAFDEIDKAKDYDFLYQIVENLKKFTILMITNEKDFLADMDRRIRSRLVVEELEFQAYKRGEVAGILEERKKFAFAPGAWSREAFDLVVDKCYSKGDMRIGLIMMREAGRAAESDSVKRITVEHVMRSKASIVDVQASDLDEREKHVLEIIKKNRGIESGKMVEKVKEEGLEIPESTLRRILQKLDKSGYIFREPGQTDTGGQTMRHYVDE
jgi:cell division control protein 6